MVAAKGFRREPLALSGPSARSARTTSAITPPIKPVSKFESDLSESFGHEAASLIDAERGLIGRRVEAGGRAVRVALLGGTVIRGVRARRDIARQIPVRVSIRQ